MNPELTQKNRRIFFYVDGFNLYYRRLRCNPYFKWLCLRTLANRLTAQIPGTVVKVKFFTALVDPASDKPTPAQKRQMIYWAALRHSGVEIIEGVLETPLRQCRDSSCGRMIRFSSEKMTDVNLALHVYRDYLEESPDVIYVVSGDCDILPAMKMVSEHSNRPGGKKVQKIICLPVDEDGLLFSRLPHHYRLARTVKLGESDIRLSVFPDEIRTVAGEILCRPDVWKSISVLPQV
jgi:uncharacterized LabA/DUF88 family protein